MAIPKPLHELDPSRAAYVRALAPYLAALDSLAQSVILREAYLAVGGGSPPAVGAVGEAVGQVGKVIRDAQSTADVMGRRDTLKAAERLMGRPLAEPAFLPPPMQIEGIAAGTPLGGGAGATTLPRVPFTEAVADIMAREPRIAASAAEVAAAYNEDHGFAMARAVEQKTVTRVQAAVSKAIHTGQTVEQGVQSIRKIARLAGEDMADWTRSYSEVVFRTNVNTAYSAGRFRQMADPAVRVAIGALRYTTAQDVDVRPNHRAAEGLIASHTDPVWQEITPPLGYNCRCSVSFVSWPELRRKGLIDRGGDVRTARVPRGAHADAGFTHTGRPDLLLYGGA